MTGQEQNLSPGSNADRQEFSEEAASLWRITATPTIWAGHFAISYGGAALWCAKYADTLGDVGPVRWGIGVLTLVSLAAIAWLGWRSWRQWDFGEEDAPAESQGFWAEGRHRFLGHAAFLLSVVSFIGVFYTALPVLLIGTCR
jgi:hypothetical protein